MLVQVNVAGLPVPPLAAFHINWTLETVTAACGFVIVMLITGLLMDILMGPGMILSHPVTMVGVTVGVNVEVGVDVIVGVEDGV